MTDNSLNSTYKDNLILNKRSRLSQPQVYPANNAPENARLLNNNSGNIWALLLFFVISAHGSPKSPNVCGVDVVRSGWEGQRA